MTRYPLVSPSHTGNTGEEIWGVRKSVGLDVQHEVAVGHPGEGFLKAVRGLRAKGRGVWSVWSLREHTGVGTEADGREDSRAGRGGHLYEDGEKTYMGQNVKTQFKERADRQWPWPRGPVRHRRTVHGPAVCPARCFVKGGTVGAGPGPGAGACEGAGQMTASTSCHQRVSGESKAVNS